MLCLCFCFRQAVSSHRNIVKTFPASDVDHLWATSGLDHLQGVSKCREGFRVSSSWITSHVAVVIVVDISR